MDVEHGYLNNVYGDMHFTGDFGFVNASVELTGNGWTSEFELRDFPDLVASTCIEDLVRDGIDAIWVLGRLKAVFGDWIGINEGEKSILNEGFVAVIKSKRQSVPFIVHDYYLRTAFLFGETLKDDLLKRNIAYAFYSLLLKEPAELVDFQFRKYHIGAGVTMVGGITYGQVQLDEES